MWLNLIFEIFSNSHHFDAPFSAQGGGSRGAGPSNRGGLMKISFSNLVQNEARSLSVPLWPRLCQAHKKDFMFAVAERTSTVVASDFSGFFFGCGLGWGAPPDNDGLSSSCSNKLIASSLIFLSSARGRFFGRSVTWRNNGGPVGGYEKIYYIGFPMCDGCVK